MKIPSVDWYKAPRVVLVSGPEDYFKESLQESALKALDGWQAHHFDAEGGEDAPIIATLVTESFFPVRKVVFVANANKMTSVKALENYCERPDGDTVLVLIASGGKLPKWYTSLKCDQHVVCEGLKPWEYKDWVASYCRRHGYAIPEFLAEAMVANVGQDLHALGNELAKVFILMGTKRREIEMGDITAVLVQHQGLAPFKVVEAWTARQKAEALRLCAMYFHQSSDAGAALPLVATLLGQVEKMLLFLSYQTGEHAKRDVCQMMGISPFVFDQLQRQCHHWKISPLRKAYRCLCDMDYRIKTGSNGQTIVNWFLSQDFEVDA